MHMVVFRHVRYVVRERERERERASERRKEREGDRKRVSSAIDIHSYLLYWSSCDIKRLTDVLAMDGSKSVLCLVAGEEPMTQPPGRNLAAGQGCQPHSLRAAVSGSMH